MAGYDDFWGKLGTGIGQAAPGMLDLGLGVYNRNQAGSEASKRLRAAQGPLYDQSMSMAGTALNRAGSMDPKAAAQEYFNAQHGLLAGTDAKTEADLMRTLQSKGMLGISNYNPGIKGHTPDGTAMNPQMAAYYAARNARDSTMAADSLNHGNQQIDSMLNRGMALQRNAGNVQSTGLQAQRTQPSRAAANAQLLKGFGGVLKDSGMLGMGTDWLRKQMGGFDFARDLDFGGLNFDGLGDVLFG